MTANETVRGNDHGPVGSHRAFDFFRIHDQRQVSRLLPLGNDAGTMAYWRSRLQSALIRQFASFQRNAGSFQIQLLYFYDQPPDESTEAKLLDFHRMMAEQIVGVVKEAVNLDE